MKKLYIIIAIFAAGHSWSQDTGQNYVRTRSFMQPYTDESAADPEDVRSVVTYYDGLGRPVETVANKMSGQSKDLVTSVTYDPYGREDKQYQPYQAEQDQMEFVSDPASDAASFYSGFREGTSNPYSQKFYEASPLNRVLKQAAPGDPWAGDPNSDNDHTVRFDYQANTDGDYVRQYQVSTTLSGLVYEPTLVFNNVYPAGELYKTITKDENWTPTSGHDHTTEEFKDKEGHIILKRTYGNSKGVDNQDEYIHDTYYVYDIYGNLSYVIPPMAYYSTLDVLDKYCYQYKYDKRNRMVAKKLPGKTWEYIAYDNLDRPVLTGPVLNPWGDGRLGLLLTKYDAFGRVIYTGWTSEVIDQGKWETRQSQLDALSPAPYESRSSSPNTIDGKSVAYTNVNFITTFKLLSVNYYDDYDFPDGPGAGTLSQDVEDQPLLSNTKGLQTGSWVRLLDDENATRGETAYTLYDTKARLVMVSKTNYLGGYTAIASSLDFAGRAKYTLTTHKRLATDNEIPVRDDYTYDAQGRLQLHTQEIGGIPQELIARNQYDPIGTLITKDVGGFPTSSIGYQRINYAYNIRGWLTQINDPASNENGDLFAFKINYNTVDDDFGGAIDPLYNGNISETYWKSWAGDGRLRKYGYKYDQLNRLTGAFYQRPEDVNPHRHSYDESASYDMNGNILHMSRNGFYDDDDFVFTIDKLDYSYNANQLLKVTDTSGSHQGFSDDGDGTSDPADDYTYDSLGNMKSDQNKQIPSNGITYNHLNLPVHIDINTVDDIDYLYYADGRKVKKTLTEMVSGFGVFTNIEYLGGYQYLNSKLKQFPHAEGYVNVIDEGGDGYFFEYAFNYTDHLGNIRMTYGYDPKAHSLKVMEEDNYYPFGLKHQNYNAQKGDFKKGEDIEIVPLGVDEKRFYKYKYNGKEWQNELGLNVTAMDYRQYDNALGRFLGIDMLSENTFSITPYQFGLNNPVFWADPSGAAVTFYNDGVEASGAEAGKLFSAIVGAMDRGWASFSVDSELVSDATDHAYEEYHNFENLSGVTVISDRHNWRNDESIIGQITSHIYSEGQYYSDLRSRNRTRQFDELQEGIGWLGVVDPTGIADGINAALYALRGKWKDAGIAGLAIVPYFGDALKIESKAAKSSAKLISQFSTRTIDDAVSYAMKNKVTHVFGKAAHNLDPLVTKLGGQENTFRTVLNAANGKLPASGVFNNVSVNVAGYNVIIRGSVVNGIPKIGTMFIP